MYQLPQYDSLVRGSFQYPLKNVVFCSWFVLTSCNRYVASPSLQKSCYYFGVHMLLREEHLLRRAAVHNRRNTPEDEIENLCWTVGVISFDHFHVFSLSPRNQALVIFCEDDMYNFPSKLNNIL
jgi:uncharacterized membrane protein YiaA